MKQLTAIAYRSASMLLAAIGAALVVAHADVEVWGLIVLAASLGYWLMPVVRE